MVRYFLAVVLTTAMLGCGKPTAPPVVETPVEIPTIPTAPTATHEMDPGKHVVPTTPASGMLGGYQFVPDQVTLKGNELSFLKSGGPLDNLQITLELPAYTPQNTVKLSVGPDKKASGREIMVTSLIQPKETGLPNFAGTKTDYALTLNLSPRQDGKIAGSISLSLLGEKKNFLAGTFTATYERDLEAPPEPDDVPYIAGRIVHTGKPKQMLQIRYVGLPTAGGEPITDMVGISLVDGPISAVRGSSYPPRVIDLRPGKAGAEYDCTRLLPGKYFLMARLDDGPMGWKLVDVLADSKIDAPLTIPNLLSGTVEVTVPAQAIGQVQAIPAGLKLDDPTGTFTTAISGALGAYGNVAEGKVSLKNLTPGKYEVSLRSGLTVYRADVLIEPGQTAKVELK
jgi:hypothetical protein